ncbi:MAG: sensor histidine kinase [Myxococcota bacterium]
MRWLWAGAAVLLLGALTLAIWMGARGPAAVASTSWTAMQDKQRLLARNGAERVGQVLGEVRRRMEDPAVRAAAGLDDARDPDVLRRGLAAMAGPVLDRHGVVLMVHDSSGRVVATDPSLPPDMASRMKAHDHRHAGEDWPASTPEVGLCDECLAHMDAASVSVPLDSGLLLGANVDVEHLARAALADLHDVGAEGAWLVDRHDHVVGADGRLASEATAREVGADWIVAERTVPGADGWRVRVAADRAAVAARAVDQTRSLLTAGAGVIVLVLLAGLLVFLGLRHRAREEQERLGRLAHQEKLASLGVIAAGVGHELRNLLTVGRGNVDFVRSITTDAEAREALDDTRDALGRMVDIAEDLRRYGRRSEGPREVMTLKEPVDSAVRLLCPRLKHRFRVEVEERAAPAIRGCSGPLAQVFVNLLRNAADAMEEAGRGHRITVRLDNGGPVARATVIDEGPGIPADVRSKLFTPFFTTKGAERGTGLGLALCARIVEAHGGTIRAGDGPSGGAAFHVEIPLASTEAPAGAKAEAEAA